MKNVIKLVMIFFIFINMSYAKAPPEPNYTYTEQNQDILITTQHPQFIIKLKSNPSTGYSWFLREYDSNMIKPVKQEYVPNPNKKLMGASGYELWTFQVKTAAFTVPQQTVIRMIYARPWQAQDAALQSVFRISIAASAQSTSH